MDFATLTPSGDGPKEEVDVTKAGYILNHSQRMANCKLILVANTDISKFCFRPMYFHDGHNITFNYFNNLLLINLCWCVYLLSNLFLYFQTSAGRTSRRFTQLWRPRSSLHNCFGPTTKHPCMQIGRACSHFIRQFTILLVVMSFHLFSFHLRRDSLRFLADDDTSLPSIDFVEEIDKLMKIKRHLSLFEVGNYNGWENNWERKNYINIIIVSCSSRRTNFGKCLSHKCMTCVESTTCVHSGGSSVSLRRRLMRNLHLLLDHLLLPISNLFYNQDETRWWIVFGDPPDFDPVYQGI